MITAASIRPEKWLMGLALAFFFLLIVPGMLAHIAACLAAALAKFAISAWIFFEKNYFLHLLFYTISLS
jgi:hypothetical protein